MRTTKSPVSLELSISTSIASRPGSTRSLETPSMRRLQLASEGRGNIKLESLPLKNLKLLIESYEAVRGSKISPKSSESPFLASQTSSES